MKSLKKRIAATALAGVMAASLTVPAFAADTEDTPQNTTTVIEGTYTAPTIAVTVPGSTTALVNPLGLPYKIGETDSGAIEVTGHEIATNPIGISNESSTDLAVSATVTSVVKGNLKLIASADAIDGKAAVGNEDDEDYQPAIPKSTANSAFVYLQLKNLTVAPTSADAEGIDAQVKATAAATAWSTTYDAEKDLVLNSTKAVTKEGMITLKKATLDTDGAVTNYAKESVAVVRLAGRVVKTPKIAWTEADGFTATVAFTFSPA